MELLSIEFCKFEFEPYTLNIINLHDILYSTENKFVDIMKLIRFFCFSSRYSRLEISNLQPLNATSYVAYSERNIPIKNGLINFFLRN